MTTHAHTAGPCSNCAVWSTTPIEQPLVAASKAVIEADDRYGDAMNGLGHPGTPHDRALRNEFDALPDVIGDCAACGGAQYGTEDERLRAHVRLRLALGLPLRKWQEHWRAILDVEVAP